MDTELTEAEARAALDKIEHSRRRVIDEIDMPQWYWNGVALGWVVLGVIADLQISWLTAVATVVFGAVHASVSSRLLGGRHRTDRLSVSTETAGRHTVLIIAIWLMGLAGVTVGLALLAKADGAGHPVTIASVIVALLVLLGGPQLMAALRRRAARSANGQ